MQQSRRKNVQSALKVRVYRSSIADEGFAKSDVRAHSNAQDGGPSLPPEPKSEWSSATENYTMCHSSPQFDLMPFNQHAKDPRAIKTKSEEIWPSSLNKKPTLNFDTNTSNEVPKPNKSLHSQTHDRYRQCAESSIWQQQTKE